MSELLDVRNVGNHHYTLTASNFSAAIGYNRNCSRLQLWRWETGAEAREYDSFMQGILAWGNENEHRAVAMLSAMVGVLPEYTGDHQKSWSIGGYSATPDGIVAVGSEVWGCEVKCPTTHRTRELVPDEYMPQIQGQCMCGLDGVFFGVWTPKSFRMWAVKSNLEYIAPMKEGLDLFRYYVIHDLDPPRYSSKANPRPSLPPVPYEELS